MPIVRKWKRWALCDDRLLEYLTDHEDFRPVELDCRGDYGVRFMGDWSYVLGVIGRMRGLRRWFIGLISVNDLATLRFPGSLQSLHVEHLRLSRSQSEAGFRAFVDGLRRLSERPCMNWEERWTDALHMGLDEPDSMETIMRGARLVRMLDDADCADLFADDPDGLERYLQMVEDQEEQAPLEPAQTDADTAGQGTV